MTPVLTLLVILHAMLAGPAGAQSQPYPGDEWVLLWLTGERPNRRAFFVQASSVVSSISELELVATGVKSPDRLSALQEDAARFRRCTLVEVCESGDSHDLTVCFMEFDREARSYRVPMGATWWRDGRQEDFSELQWRPLTGDWEKRAFAFTFEEMPWKPALKKVRDAVLAPKLGTPSAPSVIDQSELIAMDLFAMGEHLFYMDLADAMWSTVWSDGVRPAYTVPIAKLQMAQLEKRGQAGTETERRTLEAIGATLPELDQQGPPSWTEVDGLIDEMGQPDFVESSAGLRYLTYREEQIEDVLEQYNQFGIGVRKIGEILHWREYTYVVDDQGNIIDSYENWGSQ